MQRPFRHFLTAAYSSQRLSEQFETTSSAGPAKVSVLADKSVLFQTHIGFGGAFTEAAAHTFHRLGSKNREALVRAYFDNEVGHGYTLCRTHINSCDFALGNYASVEQAGDTDLKTFTLDRERREILPLIKEALAATREKVLLFASPWSPPAWMKTTERMNEGGKLKPEHRAAWAEYYVRYIREMEVEGLSIWGITVQNEPAATQPWDSCEYTAEEERDFVRDHLGPALKRAGLSDVKIIIWDHNRDMLVHRASVAYHDPEAAKYIWGAGFHWYVADKFDNVRLLHDAWPEKHLLFTEGCQEGGPHIGEWALGERYARSIINDLNHWTEGWVDWNLLLDETGGPNHVGNHCSAPILADTRTDTLLFQTSYYYIGHFSRFIRPGARRALCATTSDAVEATAYLNPDGTLAVVVMNPLEHNTNIELSVGNDRSLIQQPARSISTFVYPA
ncbi:glucosylceramidase [Terrimicrobium sacchariphilum]|uniref:Glucosylceramidase n=1 Tax=Terrimicrobium sacchariphilum TaxID=690879 RepID=A0A146G7D5_TERSA|nr:glucosylceramidase [Terrimicrobium sacchariphilum]